MSNFKQYQPMDSAAIILIREIKVYLDLKKEVPPVNPDNLAKLKHNICTDFGFLNSIPVTEFTPSTWDRLNRIIKQVL